MTSTVKNSNKPEKSPNVQREITKCVWSMTRSQPRLPEDVMRIVMDYFVPEMLFDQYKELLNGRRLIVFDIDLPNPTTGIYRTDYSGLRSSIPIVGEGGMTEKMFEMIVEKYAEVHLLLALEKSGFDYPNDKEVENLKKIFRRDFKTFVMFVKESEIKRNMHIARIREHLSDSTFEVQDVQVSHYRLSCKRTLWAEMIAKLQ